jgi:hypothetical protein
MMTSLKLALVTASLLTFADGDPLWSQTGTVVFRGQLLRRGDGPSVSQVKVQLKHGLPEGVTNDNGYFEITLPGDTRTIELQQVVLSNRQWVILYPLGAIRVPRDSSVIDVIIGLSFEAQIAQVFGKWSEELRSSLSAAGRKQDAIQQTLDTIRVQFASRAQVEAESLRVAAVRTNDRAQHFAVISATLTSYVSKAKDVRNAFKLVTEFAFSSKPALDELAAAIRAYNPVFDSLNSRGPGFVKTVGAYWQSEVLAGELNGVLDYSLGDIHRVLIFPLNATLMDINRVLTRQVQGAAAQKLREDALNKVNAAVRDLDPRLEELQRRTDNLLAKLARE